MTTIDDYGHLDGHDCPHPLAAAQWGPCGEHLPTWATHPHHDRATMVTRGAAELVDEPPTIVSHAITVPAGLHPAWADGAHLAHLDARIEHTAGDVWPTITVCLHERYDDSAVDHTPTLIQLLPWEATALADALHSLAHMTKGHRHAPAQQ